MKFRLPLFTSLKRHPTYMKLIFYFVSANVLVLAVSFALLYWQSSQTLLEEIGDHSESLLLNGARNTARLMEWSLEFSFSSSDDSTLKVNALSDQYSDFETYGVWRRLIEIKNANPSIDSVYLINDYTNTVVDSRLGLSDAEAFYDQDIIKRLQDPATTDHSVLIPRTLSIPLVGIKAKEVISIVRFYEKGSSISAFVLNIDTDNLMTLLQNNSNYANRSVTVLNDRDETVFSSIPLNQEQIAELRSQGNKGESGWKLFQPRNQEEQLMVYAGSSIKGIQDWSFIETIPKSVILGKITVLRNTSLILFLILFIASLTVIVLISKRVYSPIQELISRVMRQHQAEKPGEGYSANELDYLSNVFTAQHNRIYELTEHWRHTKILGRERFLRDFLGVSIIRQRKYVLNFKNGELLCRKISCRWPSSGSTTSRNLRRPTRKRTGVYSDLQCPILFKSRCNFPSTSCKRWTWGTITWRLSYRLHCPKNLQRSCKYLSS